MYAVNTSAAARTAMPAKRPARTPGNDRIDRSHVAGSSASGRGGAGNRSAANARPVATPATPAATSSVRPVAPTSSARPALPRRIPPASGPRSCPAATPAVRSAKSRSCRSSGDSRATTACTPSASDRWPRPSRAVAAPRLHVVPASASQTQAIACAVAPAASSGTRRGVLANRPSGIARPSGSTAKAAATSPTALAPWPRPSRRYDVIGRAMYTATCATASCFCATM